MVDSFFHAFILLFLVTDPIGNVPIFVSAMANVKAERRYTVILRECLLAFLLLLLFMLLGKHFLSALNLSETSLRIAGGLVLFLIALRMIFPQPGGIMGDMDKDGEPFIVPIAIPALAGPSAFATVLLFSTASTTELMINVGALAVVSVTWLVCLLGADWLQRTLGHRMMSAFERLMGLILVTMSVEMLLAGMRAYIQAIS